MRGDGRSAAAQHVLLHLPGRGPRQFVDERDALRRLEVRQVIARELAKFLSVAAAPARNTTNAWGASPHSSRPDPRPPLPARSGAEQHALDLDRRDVLSPADDDVLEAVADLQVAVRVHHRGIAGVKLPARERLRRRFRIAVVALHDDVALDDDLAKRAAIVATSRPASSTTSTSPAVNCSTPWRA